MLAYDYIIYSVTIAILWFPVVFALETCHHNFVTFRSTNIGTNIG